MILMNVFGKIEPIIISKKLGVGITNPDEDWVERLHEDFEKEIMLLQHDLEAWGKDGFSSSKIKPFNLSEIVSKAGWNESNKIHHRIIAEHLIEIQVLEFDQSMLKLKNDVLDSPTCEKQYTSKYLNFCSKVQSSIGAKSLIPHQIPIQIYSSDEINETPRILNFLRGMLGFSESIEKYTNGAISSLIKLGQLIDDFIETNEDFWMIDYIINSLYTDNEYNAYHIFKVMSLIEMLIINPAGNGKTYGELECKLPQFIMSKYIESGKHKQLAEIMRKLRNKIAHGDFRVVQELLQRYRNEFMLGFHYDEFEHSIESWTYISICCRLDEILNEIVWKLLSDKKGLKQIQFT